MFSYWHNSILGRYFPDSRSLGLDYSRLFLNAEKAKLTFYHELTHSLISQSTLFGRATEIFFQLAPDLKKISSNDKRVIKTEMMKAQYFLQEELATFMEIINMTRDKGKE